MEGTAGTRRSLAGTSEEYGETSLGALQREAGEFQAGAAHPVMSPASSSHKSCKALCSPAQARPLADTPKLRPHKTLKSRGARALLFLSPKCSVAQHRWTEPVEPAEEARAAEPAWVTGPARAGQAPVLLGERFPCLAPLRLLPATLTVPTGRPWQGPHTLRVQTIDPVVIKHPIGSLKSTASRALQLALAPGSSPPASAHGTGGARPRCRHRDIPAPLCSGDTDTLRWQR